MRQEKGWTEVKGILKEVDCLCRKNNIQYTLLFSTLLSQYMDNGDSEWLSNIAIGLLYPEYIKLLSIVEGTDGELYVLNRDKDKSFNAFYSWICKRSRVTLPDVRKNDLPYYGYSITVYPIIYAGDSLKEYRKTRKMLLYYLECLGAADPAPFQRGIKRKNAARVKKKWNQRRICEQSQMDSFFDSLLETGTKTSKYVTIPFKGVEKGVLRLAETYQSIEECSFEGIDALCIKNSQRWLKDCYNPKKRNRILGKKVNRAVLEGPEIIRRVQLIALENLIEFDRICRKYDVHYILSAGTLLGAVRHGGFIPWDDDIDIFILDEEWQKFEKVADEELDKSRFFLRTQKTDQDNNLVFYQIKRNDTIYVKGSREQFHTHRGVAIDIIQFYNSPNSRAMFFVQDKLCRFFKTMTWAHMGWRGETRKVLRGYYRLLSMISNKTSAKLFYRMARIQKKPSSYLTYLCVVRNPFHKGFNQRKFFEDTCEVEFEGHKFPAPREYGEFLKCSYGEDYMRLPIPSLRVNHHLPNEIDIGNLYNFEKVEG